jgi:cbb3-type cytochrome oxidase maturation protein
MEVIYLMIPMALILVGIIVWIFFWSVRSGQFDDLEGPAHEILMDDDDTRNKQTDPGSDETGS